MNEPYTFYNGGLIVYSIERVFVLFDGWSDGPEATIFACTLYDDGVLVPDVHVFLDKDCVASRVAQFSD